MPTYQITIDPSTDLSRVLTDLNEWLKGKGATGAEVDEVISRVHPVAESALVQMNRLVEIGSNVDLMQSLDFPRFNVTLRARANQQKPTVLSRIFSALSGR